MIFAGGLGLGPGGGPVTVVYPAGLVIATSDSETDALEVEPTSGAALELGGAATATLEVSTGDAMAIEVDAPSEGLEV